MATGIHSSVSTLLVITVALSYIILFAPSFIELCSADRLLLALSTVLPPVPGQIQRPHPQSWKTGLLSLHLPGIYEVMSLETNAVINPLNFCFDCACHTPALSNCYSQTSFPPTYPCSRSSHRIKWKNSLPTWQMHLKNSLSSSRRLPKSEMKWYFFFACIFLLAFRKHIAIYQIVDSVFFLQRRSLDESRLLLHDREQVSLTLSSTLAEAHAVRSHQHFSTTNA